LGVEAKIIFPVSSEAVMTSDFQPEVYAQLPIVQRVASGKGCSTASGCATCPFMKMNNFWMHYRTSLKWMIKAEAFTSRSGTK
jgi:hypothetical protein